jgi:hypothetical protein
MLANKTYKHLINTLTIPVSKSNGADPKSQPMLLRGGHA